jgi:micrococcal nuclease
MLRCFATASSTPITPLLVVAAVLLGGCGAGGGGASGSGDGPPRPDGDGRTQATITHISDGDTVTLSGLGKVRLIGVDTPEVYGGAECYGAEASAFTKRVLAPGTRVTYAIGTEAHDRYGRSLAYVWLRDGRMFNELLADRGYAVQLTIPPNVEYADRFRAAVRRAREASRGLWSPGTCDGNADEPAAGAPPKPAGPPAKHCSDFATRAEAQRWLDSHPDAPLDGDGDGVACESL